MTEHEERKALTEAIAPLLERMSLNWLRATYITCQLRADRPDLPDRK